MKTVKEICIETGHLEVALSTIGRVFIHSPSEPNGLWINHTVAAHLDAGGWTEIKTGV